MIVNNMSYCNKKEQTTNTHHSMAEPLMHITQSHINQTLKSAPCMVSLVSSSRRSKSIRTESREEAVGKEGGVD